MAGPRSPGQVGDANFRTGALAPARWMEAMISQVGCHWHCYVGKISNSPFRTPCRNARHSSGGNRSTGPLTSLLSRIPTWTPGRSATSTQFPFAWLNELLVQDEAAAGLIVSQVRRRSFMLTPRARWACWVMDRMLTMLGSWNSLAESSWRAAPMTFGGLDDQVP